MLSTLVFEPEREAEQRGPGVERKRRKIDLSRGLIGRWYEHLLDAGQATAARAPRAINTGEYDAIAETLLG